MSKRKTSGANIAQRTVEDLKLALLIAGEVSL